MRRVALAGLLLGGLLPVGCGPQQPASAPVVTAPAAAPPRLVLDSALQQVVRAYYREERGRGICYLDIDRNTRDTLELTLNPCTLLLCFDEYQPSHYAWVGRQLVLVSSGVERLGPPDTGQLGQLRRLASQYLYGRPLPRDPADEASSNYCPRAWQLRKTNATGRYEVLKGRLGWPNRHLLPAPPPPPRLLP
jgi:hypothetical protein